MSPPGATATSQRQARAEPLRLEADRLVRHARVFCEARGIDISVSKLSHIAHRWQHLIAHTGIPFEAYLCSQIEMGAWGRRNLTGTVDTTGQTAARRVDRALGLGRGWHD